MNEQLLQVTLKVLFDGQAYLFAEIQRLIAESHGHEMTDEQFQYEMNVFKLDAAELIGEALGVDEEDD